MIFKWIDYTAEYKDIVDKWLDHEARRLTGIDNSFDDIVNYWSSETGIGKGDGFWSKIICKGDAPIAVIALGVHEGLYTVSEYIVDPMLRGKGIGASALRELLKHSDDIIGQGIESAMAVIYPGNKGSQRAFEKSGFVFDSIHPDGDAMYYIYRKEV